MTKRIVFLTGTRADFGKIKSLISITQANVNFDVHIFATGMHMNSTYGKTIDEIYKSGFKNIYPFINHAHVQEMDITLAKTITGFSNYISEINPDLIIVHGDRVEALAGAIAGSLNNILVAHIEGGELSGTIDELIRHAVSKLSHIHLVANRDAELRLMQLGELPRNIFTIGSPDLDLMKISKLISIDTAKQYYEIKFDNYAIVIFHPVTTEHKQAKEHAQQFVEALLSINLNYVVIYPNNDLGCYEIFEAYQALEGLPNVRMLPSIRFEYFLSLLNSANLIIGNSSTGIREATFYGVPTVNVGSRQNNRGVFESVFHADNRSKSIIQAIKKALKFKRKAPMSSFYYGEGNSDKLFLNMLEKKEFWQISQQKQFQTLAFIDKGKP